MTDIWHAIGSGVTSILPAIRGIGRYSNEFFSIAVAVLSFYWIGVLVKKPDAIRSNRVEDQP